MNLPFLVSNTGKIMTKFVYEDLKVEFAEQFAKHYHRLENQVRDFDGSPYENHLKRCVEKLKTYARNGLEVTPQMYQIMWLHDVDEDTRGTSALISSIFGRRVAMGVYHMTNPSYSRGMSAEDKLAEQITRFSTAPGQIQTLKYIDIIDNTSDSLTNQFLDKKWARKYGKKKMKLLDHMKSGDETVWKDAYASAKVFSEV
jgi:(p)ppGpp synthase/HD superfamily hydrolase